MKKIIFFATILLCSASCAQKTVTAPLPAAAVYHYDRTLTIKNKSLSVEIADSPQSMEQGLSGRVSMADDQGMLFVFQKEIMPEFWMKRMNFGLDLIWIDKNKIVGITNDVPRPANINIADSDLALYPPPSPVDQVLEVRAGWAKQNGVAVGDLVELLTSDK